MHRLRLLTIFTSLLFTALFLQHAPTIEAAGQCSTTDNRHYMNVFFYDENVVSWGNAQRDPCLPASEVSTRTPVDITRPDNIVSPGDNWIDTHPNWKQWQCDGSSVKAAVRTFRCNTLGAGFVYLDLWMYPPYDRDLTYWDFIDTADSTQNFRGYGPRVTIPTSKIQSTSNGRYIINVWMVLATTDIQGIKVKMPGNYTHPSTDGQTVTLANGATTVATTTANPYYFLDLDPQPTYTVSVTQPAVNYSVGYTLCYNAVNCHGSGVTLGNSVNVNSPAGGYTDLWWHYWEYVGWYRLKQASLAKQGAVLNFIPPNVVPYDGFDTDEELLNIRQPAESDGIGLITTGNSIDIGPITSNVSNKNWAKTNYSANKGYLSNLSSFTSYARAKKEIKVINNLSEMESNKINIIYSDVTIAFSAFDAIDNAVLIVNGQVLLDQAPPILPIPQIFNRNRNSIAIIATGQINVHQNLTEINGIFIANSYDLGWGGVSSGTPLKVVGNLISNTAVTNIKRYRPVADYQRASLYIVFYPQYYYDLIPYLSTITQEGRQLE